MILARFEKRFDAKEILAIGTHRSGFPAWRPFYLMTEHHSQLSVRRHNIKSAILSTHRSKEQSGSRLYSDIGFLRLQIELEDVHHLSIEETFTRLQRQYVPQANCQYVCLSNRGYHPHIHRVMPTEHCQWRARTIQGQVHDANCFSLDGVGLHAGLFGTIDDVTAYAQFWLSLLQQGTLRPILTQLRDNMTSQPPVFWDQTTRGGSTEGAELSQEARGHLGYTGTSVWIDPNFEGHQAFFILLTNWTYPNDDDRAELKKIRQKFHALAAQHLRKCIRTGILN